MDWTQIGRLILMGIASLLLIVVYIWLLARLYHFLQPKGDRKHALALANQGNVPSIYQLTVESPEPLFKFKLTYKDMPLIEVPEPVFSEEAESANPDLPQKKSARRSGSLDTGKAVQAGQAVAGKVGIVASFLGALGSLLPGSLGNTLKSQGAAARGVQTKAIKTTQAPVSAQRKVDALKKQSGRVGGGVRVGGRTNQDQPEAPEIVQQQNGKRQRKVRASNGKYRVQTGEVNPGESLPLTLNIRSKKRRLPEGSFLYMVHSQQIPLAEYDHEIPPVTTRGTVYFESIAQWRYWLPIVISIIVITATMLSIFYYLTFI